MGNTSPTKANAQIKENLQSKMFPTMQTPPLQGKKVYHNSAHSLNQPECDGQFGRKVRNIKHYKPTAIMLIKRLLLAQSVHVARVAETTSTTDSLGRFVRVPAVELILRLWRT